MRFILAVIVALGAGLRFYGLARESLWNDELSTVTRLNPGPLSEVFWTRIAEDVHPPGYLLFLSGWTSLFGNGEAAVRLPSVLAGVALLLMVYAFGARSFGPTAGIAAALFCAVSPLHIRYSQEARSFALVTLTSFAATWALAESLQPARLNGPTRDDVRRNWRWLTGFVGLASASAYLSYVGFLAVGALLVFAWGAVLTKGRDRAPRLAVATLLLIVSYLPWTGGLLHHVGQGGLDWLEPPRLEDLSRVASLAIPLSGWALLCCSIALGSLWQRPSDSPTLASGPKGHEATLASLLVWMAAVLPVSFYLKSIWSTPIYNDRNLLVVVPFFASVAAIALARTVSTRAAFLSASLVGALTLSQLIWIDRFYTAPLKQDFRGAAALAADWLKNGSAEEVVCLAWNKSYFSYYLERAGTSTEPRCTTQGDQLVSRLRKASKPGKPVAFVYGHIVPSDAVWRGIRKEFSIREVHRLHKAGAALLEPK